MKNLLFLILILPMTVFSQGLLVSTSTSGDLLESNLGASKSEGSSIVVTSLILDSDIIESINEDVNRLVRVYPNPTQGLLIIDTKFDQLEIFDLTVNRSTSETLNLGYTL